MRQFSVVAVLFLAACGRPADSDRQAEQAPATDGALAAGDTSAVSGCRQFTEQGLRLSARSRAGLEAEAGRPTSTNVRVEPNRHASGVKDSIFRFEYDGLSVQLRVPGPGGEMIEHVAVTDRKWLTFPYFRPGVSAERVIQALGEPQRREGNSLIYDCASGEVPAPVAFELNEGIVQRIVFNYYVD